MLEFALIFRPTRSVEAAQLPQRNAAAREWALALKSEGGLRYAAPLDERGVVVSENGTAPVARQGAIASVLIIQAENLERAAALAKGHPGLAYGTDIEIRPVKAVGPSK